jgi:hypothetical protein
MHRQIRKNKILILDRNYEVVSEVTYKLPDGMIRMGHASFYFLFLANKSAVAGRGGAGWGTRGMKETTIEHQNADARDEKRHT